MCLRWYFRINNYSLCKERVFIHIFISWATRFVPAPMIYRSQPIKVDLSFLFPVLYGEVRKKLLTGTCHQTHRI